MTENLERDEAIARIRRALRARTGRDWSVRGGRGTAWGWITITAPPRRLQGYVMTVADRHELGRALGLGAPVHGQGVSVPASSDHWAEFVDRAEGRPPRVIGRTYWD